MGPFLESNYVIKSSFSVFMAEEGISCVTDHQGDLLNCLNSTDPELFGGNFQKTSWIMFDQSHCRSVCNCWVVTTV